MRARRRLFHFVLPEAWRAHVLAGELVLAPPSLSSEGFVHLSYDEQLRGTLDTHFNAMERVLLFEIQLPENAPELRVESSRGGALFPHLYRALNADELARAWILERTSGGWELPLIRAESVDDAPRGRDPRGLEAELQ